MITLSRGQRRNLSIALGLGALTALVVGPGFACGRREKSHSSSSSDEVLDANGLVSEQDPGTPGDSEPGSDTPPAPGTVKTVTERHVQYGRSRILTPEQFGNLIERALAFRKMTPTNHGRTGDWVNFSYGVALGGVDFKTQMTRDPSTTPQYFLAARAVAFRLASDVVTRDAERWEGGKEPMVFRLADPRNDRPFIASDQKKKAAQQTAAREAEKRWSAQIDDLYLRLYQRPPSQAERDLVREKFAAIYLGEGRRTTRAWALTLMSLLSTLEFWTQ